MTRHTRTRTMNETTTATKANNLQFTICIFDAVLGITPEWTQHTPQPLPVK